MVVKQKSNLTGKIHTKSIDVTKDQINKWQNGELIQNVMPNLDTWDREFLISGITKEEWENAFGKEE